MDMGMKMAFYASAKVRILFKGWNVTTVGGLVGSVFAVLVLAILHEGLKSFNGYLNLKQKKAKNESMPLLVRGTSSGMARYRSCGARLSSTFRYVVQLTFGYLLMLIGMTYNTWLFLTIIIGCGIGYYLFNPWQVGQEQPDNDSNHSEDGPFYGSQQT